MLVEPAAAGMVKLGGTTLIERLVWSVVIVGVAPAFKSALLSGQIGRGRLGRFGLQIPVHAPIRSVVLRAGRTGKLDPDALRDPPDTQAPKPAKANRGERRAVINPDDLG